MLDSTYHMTLKLFWNHIFGVKTLGFAICITLKASLHKVFTSGLSLLLHDVISLPDAASYDKFYYFKL